MRVVSADAGMCHRDQAGKVKEQMGPPWRNTSGDEQWELVLRSDWQIPCGNAQKSPETWAFLFFSVGHSRNAQ